MKYPWIYPEIHYKTLAPVFMNSDKSHNVEKQWREFWSTLLAVYIPGQWQEKSNVSAQTGRGREFNLPASTTESTQALGD